MGYTSYLIPGSDFHLVAKATRPAMTFSDFTILYLSFGAPVAAVAFLWMSKSGTAPRLIGALSAWALWPVAALYFAGKPTHRRAVMGVLDASAQISRNASTRSATVREFDASTTSLLAASETFLLRETLERYVALFELIENATSDIEDLPENEFFMAAASASGATGTKCLARRNRARLTKHLSRARMDLVRSMALLPAGEARLAARADLIRLFESFGDAEGKQAVSESISGSPSESVAQPDIIKFNAV